MHLHLGVLFFYPPAGRNKRVDPTFLTALTGLFVASGGAVGFFIKRADTRRQTNEAALIAHLTKELERERARSALLAESLEIRTADGEGWRDQLLEHDIKPIPERWTPLPKEDR